jgi:hypothetical protein
MRKSKQEDIDNIKRWKEDIDKTNVPKEEKISAKLALDDWLKKQEDTTIDDKTKQRYINMRSEELKIPIEYAEKAFDFKEVTFDDIQNNQELFRTTKLTVTSEFSLYESYNMDAKKYEVMYIKK